MVMTDPIADMLTRMRNALSSRKKSVALPASTLKVALAEAMRREGYIQSFEVTSEGVAAKMTVKFRFGPDGEPAIQNIKRISTPGCRRYRTVEKLPKVLGGLGVAILSTPKGVLSDRECREQNVGGELLCTIY
jgi:small subunit ribosomal protein S8